MMSNNNNTSNLPPVFIDGNHLQYHTNPSNHLQLFGNFPVGYKVDPVNCYGNDRNTSAIQPNKRRSRETENITPQQKLQISLKYNNVYNDEAARSGSMPNKNPVCTGLRLAYDDDERNSSVTSASGSMTAAPSMIMSLGDNIRTELDRQNEEFDHYIKIQEENLTKGVRDMKQRHIASFLMAIEKGVSQKLQEKDMEIEGINRKNKDLVEKIKQVASEAQNWHYRAKYNESMVNVLKNNLDEAISKGAADQANKEGFGDSDQADDAASFAADQAMRQMNMICRGCKGKEVCMLLIPCRHLSLCKDCDVFIHACPICQSMKTDSVQVYLS